MINDLINSDKPIKIRTRFAPSPTGYIHVGNVRAALFAWLFARHEKGDFILRIEDTDQARFVEGSTDLIIDTLKWLGISWDEGPDIGGDYGPYTQTQRREHYKTWAQKLIDKGLAYADPYTPEQVNEFRNQAKAAKKAFLFRDFRPQNPPVWDGSQPLRFKVPNIRRYSWHDAIMGDLSAGPEALDDFILIKSDGLPTYNFAHVIDDTEMEITHVIRGMEYIPSIPKYLSLYEALEITPPIMACSPHIMSPDGKKKLGKRDGAKSVQEYKEEGILHEAMLNFIASLGWNDGTEQEIFSCDELVEKFSLDRVGRSGARFDEKRLVWLNGQWIRKLSIDDLYERCESFWPESSNRFDVEAKKRVLLLAQDRLKTLADLPVLTSYFFEEPIPNWDMVTDNKLLNKLSNDEVISLLEESKIKLGNTIDYSAEEIQNILNGLLETTGQKPAILFSLIRLALSWAPFSPALNETISVIGREKVDSRLSKAIETAKQTRL